MGTAATKLILVDSHCDACSTHAFHAYHANFPEMRIEHTTAEGAVHRLIDRLIADLDCISDPSHRETVQSAIDDARAFLAHEEKRATGAVC
jgi:hypothetical protein